MAVTINKSGIPGETVKGVRIVVDPEKTVNIQYSMHGS